MRIVKGDKLNQLYLYLVNSSSGHLSSLVCAENLIEAEKLSQIRDVGSIECLGKAKASLEKKLILKVLHLR